MSFGSVIYLLRMMLEDLVQRLEKEDRRVRGEQSLTVRKLRFSLTKSFVQRACLIRENAVLERCALSYNDCTERNLFLDSVETKLQQRRLESGRVGASL
jgi:hypothetical protein